MHYHCSPGPPLLSTPFSRHHCRMHSKIILYVSIMARERISNNLTSLSLIERISNFGSFLGMVRRISRFRIRFSETSKPWSYGKKTNIYSKTFEKYIMLSVIYWEVKSQGTELSITTSLSRSYPLIRIGIYHALHSCVEQGIRNTDFVMLSVMHTKYLQGFRCQTENSINENRFYDKEQ